MIGIWTSQPIDTAHCDVGRWVEISSGAQLAPSGTAYGRALVRINNDGSGAGRVYYDDVDVTGMIPEPTVVSLMAGGLLGVLGLRRMRR
ncbi:MAG TPA: PEP-CTERM sorting domain-containing protein [Kiritimatiellae bacterium]|nr:PEP-CTERM sorting domain-containing protein [Kiritimatiellia bacterium]